MDAIGDLINPSLLPSLKNDYEIKVYIVRDPLRPPKEPIRLRSIFPFSTIEDVKREIWLHEDGDLDALPKFQFVGILRGNPYEEEYPQTGQKYYAADSYYYDATDKPIQLKSPLELLRSGSEVDDRFVDTDGRLQPLKITKRDRTKLETIFQDEEDMPILHCYFLSGLINYANLVAPISEFNFNGRLAPYFPGFGADSILTPTDEDRRFVQTLEAYARGKRQIQETVNRFIEDNQEKLRNLTITAIQYLRLAWKQRSEKFQGSQGLFYNIAANERRPFIRFLPVDGIPLTKLYSPGGLTIVDSISIENIKSWAQEKSPLSDKDYVFFKVLLSKSATTSVSSLFGTLRIQEDGTGDFILMPPKNLRKLDPSTDLRDLEKAIIEAIDKTGFEGEGATLEEASTNVYLSLEADAKKISKADMRSRVKRFSAFFQEIDPLPNEQPLIMLRYKGVSNFANEDSVASFITQIIGKNIQGGVEIDRLNLRKQVIHEFGLEEQDAKRRIDAWFAARSQFGVANAEKNEIKQLTNSGVDIAVFEQHPYYFFHIYRAQGNEDLKRIYTLLSTLLSMNQSELAGSEEVSVEVQSAVETFVDEEGDLISPESPVEPNSPVAELAPPVQVEEEGDEDLGDFLAYAIGDEEETSQENAQNPYEADVKVAPMNTLPPPEEEDTPGESGIDVITETKPKIKLKLKKTSTVAEKDTVAPSPLKDEGPVKAGSFLIDRLKKLDKDLFAYKKPTKADKSIKHYSSGCQAQDDRQPLGITPLEYKIMKERYEKDIDEGTIFFMEYPISGTSNPETPPRDAEIVNILKYGSDPAHQNYFLCPKYFCIRDNIPLIESEYIGIIDRQGKRKPAQTCPFCHGKRIIDKNVAIKGETVYVRKNKPKTDKPHLFIGMLTKQRTPQGLSQPCCFGDPVELRKAQAYFTHIREYDETQEPATTTAIANSVQQKHVIASKSVIESQEVNYQILKNNLYAQYIVGPEKYPLEPGKVGIPAPALDTYLGQVSSSFVERSAVRQELTPNAKGFLRIGVSNSTQRRNISILAALAPYLLTVDTPEQVAGFIWRAVMPPIFQNLNFGNLVLEFYDPAFEDPATDNELKEWVKNWFDVQDLSKNRDHFLRLWKSYNKFISLLKDVEAGKQVRFQFELRHFVHMLAEPGILTTRGITFIVLEYSGLPVDPATNISVKCPLHGFNSYAHANNDIGFITHSSQGAWEPLVFTENTPAKGEDMPIHEGVYLFQSSRFNEYLNTIRARITEFRQKCNSSGLGAFTATTGVDPKSLIPKYKLLYQVLMTPEGLLRDAYNHLVGVVFEYPKSKRRSHVYVPFADDGTLFNIARKFIDPQEKKFEIKRVHYGFDDMSPAPTDSIIKFYREFIAERFSLYKGYGIKRIIIFNNERYAVQLENGILIPASSISKPTEFPDIQIINAQGKDPEWYIDTMIVAPKEEESISGFAADKILYLKRREAEEVYNHLRLTFANYVASSEAGPQLRQQIRNIISRRDLDLYERRKRLEIRIGSMILSWLTPTDSFSPKSTLLRIDCNIQDKGQCDNFCIWKETEQRCSIHSPNTILLGGREEVNAPRFFMLRLIDELLRIPTKQRQLLNKDVPYLSAPKTKVVIGDQTIIPEQNAQWYQSLIEDIMPKQSEQPQYYEEFKGKPEFQVESKFIDRYVLPDSLKTIIGLETDFRLWPAHDLYALFVGFNIDLGAVTGNNDLRKLDANALNSVRKNLKKTVIQVDLTGEGTQITGSSIKTQELLIIVILETGQPAILVNAETPDVPLIFKNMLGKEFEGRIDSLPAPKVILKRPTAGLQQQQQQQPRSPAT